MFRSLIFFLLVSPAAFCQQRVEGTIIDRDTGAPVPFASVGIVGTSKGTSSNSNGEFLISLTEPFSLKVSCIGYESIIVSSLAEVVLIKLKPMVTQLNTIVILARPINAKKILRKAFAQITDNYDDEPFLQKFFYRHYCKDGNEYGRLIEASVDVWKDRGYRYLQNSAGEREEIRVTQLRRSFDKTEIAQGHEPIGIANILQADIVAYQTPKKSDHLAFYTDVSNLKTDMESYSFTGLGITSYDGQEVYQITYSYKKDSMLLTSGNYQELTQITGSLYITTDSHAIVKSEETKKYGNNSVRTSAYYQKFADKYYPYHFVRDGESLTSDNDKHVVHIELMAVEIGKGASEKFTDHIPGREELLDIPYDSSFWSTHTILKTTPLEDDIIRDLGGGVSLNKQFHRYRQYQMNVRKGGENGEEKFNWLKEDSKGNRILYLVFWSGNLQSDMMQLELAKQLQKQYRNKIMCVFLSLDDDENAWQQTVQRYSLFANGVINYRIGSHSQLAKTFGIKETPSFILLSRHGELFSDHAKRPGDASLEQDFKTLIDEN